MGPMGPMMGRWPGGSGDAATLLGALVVLLVLFVLALVALSALRGTGMPAAGLRRRQPGDVLRERYARGEIGWQAYQEALVNLLKDRYVRGELELAEYEQRLARLLQPGLSHGSNASTGHDPVSPRRASDSDGEAGG